MRELQHHYSVQASAGVDTDVVLTAAGIPDLATASPAEFGGPGDRWSPETLLVGAVANCFVLTFRAVARASKRSRRISSACARPRAAGPAMLRPDGSDAWG